jgi:hypothetical protein
MNTKIKIMTVLSIVGLLLSGCAKKPTATVTQADDYFPDVDRTTLVTPATRKWESTKVGTTATVDKQVSQTNLKVGSTLKIKNSRYGVAGIVRITSTTSIRLENFTYNGTCTQGIKVYLASSNKIKEPVVDLAIGNTVYTDTTKDYPFPANITVNDVDSFVFWCTKDTDPTYSDKLY